MENNKINVLLKYYQGAPVIRQVRVSSPQQKEALERQLFFDEFFLGLLIMNT